MSNPEELFLEIQKTIARRISPPAGALFTFAIRRTPKMDFHLGAVVRFSDSRLSPRQSIHHSKMVLLEEWVEGVEASVAKIESIYQGSGEVDSTLLPQQKLQHTSVESSDRWNKSETGWKEWIFKSRFPLVEGSYEGRQLPDEPIVTFGCPPFMSGSHAIHEWLDMDAKAWKSDTNHPPGELIVRISDARARVATADWSGSVLSVELDVNVPEQKYQVQVFYGGSKGKRQDFFEAQMGTTQCDIPEETESIRIFVVDSSNELLSSRVLERPATAGSAKVVTVTEEERTRKELEGGESATVEFKPFVKTKDLNKEGELIKTVVAFSNSNGGRLYVGVDDTGVPQGLAELKKVLDRGNDDNVDSLLKSLHERVDVLLRGNVKPVPRFELKIHDKHGRPVLVVDVQRGEQPPYATLQNEYFVRHGSSSMRPDPGEMRRMLQKESIGGIFLNNASSIFGGL